jgi:hypothetical protein
MRFTHQHYTPYKSDTKAVVPGSPMDLFDFVPLRGPKGGRVVVDKFIVVVTGTITVATATWDGRDVPRLLGLISVEQRDGKQRWMLSGYKSRIASIRYNGIEEHQEHGNVSVGAGQAINLRLIIPMSKPFVVRPKDFALPADIFRKMTLTFAPLASAQTGTAVLSAAALSAYVLAEWHEEMNIEFKAEDVVKSVDFNSNTQARLALNGVVHDLDVVKEASTAGGDVVSAITDARIEDLGTPLLTFGDLQHIYTMRRQLAPSGPGTPATERYLDPVRESKCLPIITAGGDTSLWDGLVVQAMKVDVGTGAAGLSLISREVVPKAQANVNATIASFGVNHKTLRMKTESKSRRGMGEGWSQRQRLVGVWSAPLPKAA